MIVKSPAGVTVVTIGDTAVVGGYLGTVYQEGERAWRRIVHTSPVVDGDFETQAVLAGRTLTVEVYIEGSDWAQVSTRRATLLAAVEIPRWQLTVGTVTWICRPADSLSPIPPQGNASTWRVVTLTIPVDQQIGV
jgi:hypothetical protein